MPMLPPFISTLIEPRLNAQLHILTREGKRYLAGRIAIQIMLFGLFLMNG